MADRQERLADLVQSYAHMTNRLREALIAPGLVTSAQVSERPYFFRG